MEWLSKILEVGEGEEFSAEEVQEKIQKELPKYFIPKEKFNAVKEEVSSLKSQLGERDEQLSQLKEKAKDNEDLTKQIEDLESENKRVKEEAESKTAKQKFDFALELKLRDYKAKNPKAVKALIDTEKLKLNDDETFTGLDEQIKALEDSDGYLFGEDKVTGTGEPEPGKAKNDYKGKNPWSKDTFNLTEQAKIMRENPDLAKVLASQTKK